MLYCLVDVHQPFWGVLYHHLCSAIADFAVTKIQFCHVPCIISMVLQICPPSKMQYIILYMPLFLCTFTEYACLLVYTCMLLGKWCMLMYWIIWKHYVYVTCRHRALLFLSQGSLAHINMKMPTWTSLQEHLQMKSWNWHCEISFWKWKKKYMVEV